MKKMISCRTLFLMYKAIPAFKLNAGGSFASRYSPNPKAVK